MILVAVVALAAIGILMVYSSSAIEAYLSRTTTRSRSSGRRSSGRCSGIVAMVVMMRVDYRWLRLVVRPDASSSAIVAASCSSSCPSFNIVVGGSARWLKIGPLPAIHPAEIAKLALVIYLAHWFAKRGHARSTASGAARSRSCIIVAPVVALVFKEPDLGHDRRSSR